MSEEQTSFKVTDRRLFNADGTPRDLPPEEKPEPTKAVTEAAPPPVATSAESKTSQNAEAEAPAPAQPDRVGEEEDVHGAEDPASFLNFLMTIASNAASSLGMMEHPVTRQRDVDLELGKHWIDVVAMLQDKTRGNLTAQEKQILEGLLSDLRMQYVSLVNSATAKAPHGFSGRDILGGK